MNQINYKFENYLLLSAERLLLRDGKPVALKPKVFETLLTLVRNHNRLLTKEELMRLIWSDNFVEEGNLSQYIFTLRKVFGEKLQDHRFIVTVPGQGYIFVAKVEEDKSVDIAAARERDAAPGNRIKSVAILPLRALAVEESNAYLGLAVADTLITRVSANKTVTVCPTATVIKYTESDADPVVTGRDLKVDVVGHGTITQAGAKIRVNIQLTDVRTLKTIWANKFDGEVADIFSFQDQLVEQVAESLMIELSASGRNSKIPASQQVYQTYLKGRFFWESRSELGLFKALNCAGEVVAAEPDFPFGYIGISDSYLLLGEYLFLAPGESFPKARAAADEALRRDPFLAEAHASLAEYFFYYKKDWRQAESLYKKSIKLDPNYACAYHWYAWLLFATKRFDEALACIEKAQELDPNSLILSTIRGLPFYYKKDYERAIRQFRDILEIDPKFTHAQYYLGSALFRAGETEAGIAELEKMSIVEPLQQTFGLLGYCYAATGKKEQARSMLVELDRIERERYVSNYVRAVVFSGLGENEQALSFLKKAFDENEAWLVWLNTDPFFDNLRDEPEFRELVESLGF